MRARTLSLILLFLAVAVFSAPRAWAGGPEVFELTDPSVDSLGVCQNVHRIADCSTYHVSGVTITLGGLVIDLEGRLYGVDWSGPGYYMESGAIFQPAGPLEDAKAGLRGQRWVEVYPEAGRVHVSYSWNDLDGNRALSPSDTLILEKGKAAKAQKVQDVRLIVVATPLSQP